MAFPTERLHLTFRIDGDPVSERRHRTRGDVLTAADGSQKVRVQTFADPLSAAWREGAVWQLRPQAVRQGLRGTPLCGPVNLHLVIWRARPTSYPAAVTRDVWKPDWDNYAKAACDALTEAGIWFDDGLIDEARVSKRFATELDPPGIDVVLLADPPQSLR